MARRFQLGVLDALRRVVYGPARPEFQRAATRAKLLRAVSILTPREQLIPLMTSDDSKIVAEAVRTFQAGSHILSADEQITLAATPHLLTHQLILEQAEVQEGVLKTLIGKPDRLIRDLALERFLRHKGYEGFGDLEKAASEITDCPEFVRAVARSFYATLNVMQIIVQSPDREAAEMAKVRIEREFLPEAGGWGHGLLMLRRNGVSSYTLVRLIVGSSSKRIAARALTKLIEKDKIDETTLSEIADSPHQRIRKYVAGNPLTPQNILGKYLEDPSLAMPAFRNLESRKLLADELFRKVYSAYGAKPEWQRIMAASSSCPRQVLVDILKWGVFKSADLAFDKIVERDLAGPDITLISLKRFERIYGNAYQWALRKMFLKEGRLAIFEGTDEMFVDWGERKPYIPNWDIKVYERVDHYKFAILVPRNDDISPFPMICIEIAPTGYFQIKWVRAEDKHYYPNHYDSRYNILSFFGSRIIRIEDGSLLKE